MSSVTTLDLYSEQRRHNSSICCACHSCKIRRLAIVMRGSLLSDQKTIHTIRNTLVVATRRATQQEKNTWCRCVLFTLDVYTHTINGRSASHTYIRYALLKSIYGGNILHQHNLVPKPQRYIKNAKPDIDWTTCATTTQRNKHLSRSNTRNQSNQSSCCEPTYRTKYAEPLNWRLMPKQRCHTTQSTNIERNTPYPMKIHPY